MEINHSAFYDPENPHPLAGAWLWGLTAAMGLFAVWVLCFPFAVDFSRNVTFFATAPDGTARYVANALVYVPFSFCTAWLVRSVFRRQRTAFIIAIVIGTLLALGVETLHSLMPGKYNSNQELIAAAIGVAAGAISGQLMANLMTSRWLMYANWCSHCPIGARALGLVLLMVVARLVPFDVSPDVQGLRLGLEEAHEMGLPFASYRAYTLADTADAAALSGDALYEVTRFTISVALFAMCGLCVSLALREVFMRAHDTTTPWFYALVSGFVIVMSTELFQWPIYSRVMDLTDLLGGLVGIVLGVLLDLMIGARLIERMGVTPARA